MADIQTSTWTETASGNSATPPNGMPEGQSAASVNDGVREIMGAIKRDYNRSHATQTSTGTGSAYVLSYTVNPPAWENGMIFAFRAHVACAQWPTCAPGLLAAKHISVQGPSQIDWVVAGTIRLGQIVVVSYDSATDTLVMLSPRPPAPPADLGDIKATALGAAPPGWLFCQGQAVSRTTYAALFAAMGAYYGSGDGSTTFNLPDYRGRGLIGADAGAGRVTPGVAGFDGGTLGAVGGSQYLHSHGHGFSDPGHAHGYFDPGHVHGVNDPGHAHGYLTRNSVVGGAAGGAGFWEGDSTTTTGGAATGVYLSSSGTGITISAAATGASVVSNGSGSSQNMPPSAVVNWLIYAGV